MVEDLRFYGSSAVAREVGVSLRQLYYWVGVLQVVRPQRRQHGTRVFRRFDGAHLKTLKQMRRLLERGFTLQAAARMIRAKARPGLGGLAGRGAIAGSRSWVAGRCRGTEATWT